MLEVITLLVQSQIVTDLEPKSLAEYALLGLSSQLVISPSTMIICVTLLVIIWTGHTRVASEKKLVEA